jgi:hypothetical protein
MAPALPYTSTSPNSIRFMHLLQGSRTGALVVVVSNIGGKDANTMSQKPISNTLPGIMVDFGADARLVDLLSCETVMVGTQGTFESKGNGGNARV